MLFLLLKSAGGSGDSPLDPHHAPRTLPFDLTLQSSLEVAHFYFLHFAQAFHNPG